MGIYHALNLGSLGYRVKVCGALSYLDDFCKKRWAYSSCRSNLEISVETLEEVAEPFHTSRKLISKNLRNNRTLPSELTA
jgi:hypothetical protein